MKLDLKLLCLALVLCQQSGRAATCKGGNSAVTCNGKPGGELELKATGASEDVTWTKGDSDPTDTEKYTKSGDHKETLKILQLADGDEATYKATATGINGKQEFIVNVADCVGGPTEVTCNGRVGGKLKLKATGAKSGTVSWVKIGTPTNTPIDADTAEYERGGPLEDSLKILKLKADSMGTYQASGGGMTKEQKFKVEVTTDDGGGGNSGGSGGNSGGSGGNSGGGNSGGSGGNSGGSGGNSGGSGGGNSGGSGGNSGSSGGNSGSSGNKNAKTTNTTTTSVGNRNAKGLSYSPALLVTTLVHLLLQLAY